MDVLDSARRLLSAGAGFAWNGVEQLEPRVLLSTTPLPDLDDMEDKDNTLVRIETDMGTVDLEMYDVAGPDGGSAAPNTVANFLDRLRKGDYDLSFFHRSAKYEDDTNFVLQGGGFKFDDTTGLEQVPERDRIDNEFNVDRSNIARTISMARLGGDENSASSQWFFNLRTKNAKSLDDDKTVDGTGDGYCVFGHVLNDDSWDVVLSIAALTRHNYQDFNDPLTGALNEVPTKDDLSDVDPKPALSSEQLIDISDVEIIKEANTETFYRARAAYPEGYRGPGTVESVELVNPDPDHAVLYQVIVRYERGMGRDQVIKFGTLDPNLHLHIPVSDFNDPTLDLVQGGVPFAYEVQATGSIGAALNHYDFGATTGESFINLDTTPLSQLQTWAFGGTSAPFGAPPDATIVRRPFLVWDNMGDAPAELTITFTLQTGGRVVWHRTTDPKRRDGLEVFNLKNVTRDIASIRIVSDQNIVAAFTVYDTIIDPTQVLPPMSPNNAFTALGTVAGGLKDGVLAGVKVGEQGSSYVTFVNDTDSGASVTVNFIRSNGATTDPVLVAVPARSRKFLNLRPLGIPSTEYFTIAYHSPLVAVAGEYVSTINGDTVSTPFATYASSQQVFAGGKLDPSDPDEKEVLSIYNPYEKKKVSVSITFNFADDKIQGIPALQFDLDPLHRKDIGVRTLAQIVAKINSGAEFANYAIIVNVTLFDDGGTGGGSIGAAGVVAQLTRFDLLGAITTNASLFQFTVPLDSPLFGQGTVS